MREDALAVDCPALEPDTVLLAQLTALAAASTAPPVKPWWQRMTAKTGAAAVAAVLLISGATADAEHGRPAPIAEPIVGVTPTVTHHKHAPKRASHTSVVSPVVPAADPAPMRHAGDKTQHSRHRQHVNAKHEDRNSNGGGSQNGEGSAPVARLATLLPVLLSQNSTERHSHSHAHLRHHQNSQH